MDEEVSENKIPSKAWEEANAWAVRMDDQSDDSELQAAFESWLATSPSHAEEYEKAKSALSEMTRPELVEAFLDEEQIMGNGFSRRSVIPRFYGALAAAASIALIFGLAAFYIGHPEGEIQRSATAKLEVLTLPDGSTLELDAASAVELVFDESQRTVRLLSGSAVFDIEEDIRPFEVLVGDHRIRDIGTVFSVSLRTGIENIESERVPFTVAVEEGEVEVSRIDDETSSPLSLFAGQKTELIPEVAKLPEPQAIELESFAPWRKGEYRYQDRPLSEVLADLQRHCQGRIFIEDEWLSEQRVTGILKVDNLDEAFAVLARVLPLKMIREGDERIEILRVDS
ncbi:MAG: FecR domain-containing protein [Verrucomicrobiota bacterium]